MEKYLFNFLLLSKLKNVFCSPPPKKKNILNMDTLLGKKIFGCAFRSKYFGVFLNLLRILNCKINIHYIMQNFNKYSKKNYYV